jgi:FOG: TPR repeat, SEL1 subfamily
MKRLLLLLLILTATLTVAAQTSDKENFARNYELAKLGEPIHMYNVGKGYFEGKGIAKNHDEAFKWFLQAAQKDNLKSIEMVAYMYLYEDGTDFDLLEGIYWLKKGADMGSGYCMCGLGNYYLGFDFDKLYYSDEDEDEEEVTKLFTDKKKGIEWLKKAASTGYDTAKKRLKQLGETW